MPKKRAAKLRPDVNEIAFRVVQEATGQAEKTSPPDERTDKNPEAVRRGRLGGQKGGMAKAKNLSQQERAEAARLAAQARWKKKG